MQAVAHRKKKMRAADNAASSRRTKEPKDQEQQDRPRQNSIEAVEALGNAEMQIRMPRQRVAVEQKHKGYKFRRRSSVCC